MGRRYSGSRITPTVTDAASRTLAFERLESRFVMDHAMSVAIPWTGESDIFFDGATATIRHGRELFIVDVAETTPNILSTTSLDSYPAAVALDGQELTLVMSSHLGTSEILIYDLSDPMNPVKTSSQPIDGAVTRVWIADERIVLLTIDPRTIPEPIEAITIDDLYDGLNPSESTEPADSQISLSNRLESEVDSDSQGIHTIDSQSSWTNPEVTIQIYDRDRLTAGPIIHQWMHSPFDDILMIPGGIVTLSSALMTFDESGNSIPWTEVDSIADEPMTVFSTTVLSRWTIDESTQSIELVGDTTLQKGYPDGSLQSVIIDGTAYLFLLTANDSNPWDLTLHRFRMGDEKPWEHTELNILGILEDSWFQDFMVEGKTGFIATSSQLLTVDLFAEPEPKISNAFDFPDEVSAWKQLRPDRWLRVSNPFKYDGGVDDRAVSLEVIDLLNNSYEVIDKTTVVAERGLAWSCFGPSAFTFLPDTGLLVANVQQSSETTHKLFELDSILEEPTTNEVSVADLMNRDAIPLSNWQTDLFLFRVNPMGKLSNLGSVQTPSEVTQLHEFKNRITFLADHELFVIDLTSPNLSTSSVALFPKIDLYEAWGIDRDRLVNILYQTGLGFIDPLMKGKNRGSTEDLELERTVLEGGGEWISITIGGERWEIHTEENGASQLMVGALQTTSESDPQPDVNGDGIVDKNDISMLLSNINQRGFYPKPTVLLDEANGVFMDVDGDGWLSALDPLMVINWINSANNLDNGQSTLSKTAAAGVGSALGWISNPAFGMQVANSEWINHSRDEENPPDSKAWFPYDAIDSWMSNLIDFQRDAKPLDRVLPNPNEQESEPESLWNKGSEQLEESLLDQIASSLA